MGVPGQGRAAGGSWGSLGEVGEGGLCAGFSALWLGGGPRSGGWDPEQGTVTWEGSLGGLRAPWAKQAGVCWEPLFRLGGVSTLAADGEVRG